MQRTPVDGLNFDFPDNWQVSQYDNWSFYRNQVARMWNGIKALDLLAVLVCYSMILLSCKMEQN